LALRARKFGDEGEKFVIFRDSECPVPIARLLGALGVGETAKPVGGLFSLAVRHVSEFNRGMTDNPMKRTDAEWRETLTPELFHILREAGSERPFTGELLNEERAGLYTCGGCGAELFVAGTKFDSHCGWPSFYETINPEAVTLIEDNSLGQTRTEVRCAACDGHLGHVFPDGFGTPTGLRYCMNSIALKFTPGD
jgi:peptide-methionine (R)-S-oxide reductase